MKPKEWLLGRTHPVYHGLMLGLALAVLTSTLYISQKVRKL